MYSKIIKYLSLSLTLYLICSVGICGAGVTYEITDRGIKVIDDWDPAPEKALRAAMMREEQKSTSLAPLEDTFTLHSNPGASKVIYLDFDGRPKRFLHDGLDVLRALRPTLGIPYFAWFDLAMLGRVFVTHFVVFIFMVFFFRHNFSPVTSLGLFPITVSYGRISSIA